MSDEGARVRCEACGKVGRLASRAQRAATHRYHWWHDRIMCARGYGCQRLPEEHFRREGVKGTLTMYWYEGRWHTARELHALCKDGVPFRLLQARLRNRWSIAEAIRKDGPRPLDAPPKQEREKLSKLAEERARV